MTHLMTRLVTCLEWEWEWLRWLMWPTWWPACLPFINIRAFRLPPAMWPIPCLLPGSLSMIVVLPMPTFFAITLIDNFRSCGKLSLACHRAWAWSIFSAFHCWFHWFLCDIRSYFCWGVRCFFPFLPFALNFSLAIVLRLKNKSVEWPACDPLGGLLGVPTR